MIAQLVLVTALVGYTPPTEVELAEAKVLVMDVFGTFINAARSRPAKKALAQRMQIKVEGSTPAEQSALLDAIAVLWAETLEIERSLKAAVRARDIRRHFTPNTVTGMLEISAANVQSTADKRLWLNKTHGWVKLAMRDHGRQGNTKETLLYRLRLYAKGVEAVHCLSETKRLRQLEREVAEFLRLE